MRVRDIMTTPVMLATLDQRPKDVARLLLQLRIAAMPVVDADRCLVGIVSEADLVGLERVPDPRAHLLLRRAPAPRPAPRTIEELMTRSVVTIGPDDDTADAATVLLEHGFRSLPVVTGDEVVGIVARRDLLRALARRDRDIQAELEDLLEDQTGLVAPYKVDVTDGVATLTGPTDAAHRELPELLARTVPGVVEVRFAAAPADVSG